MKDGDYIAIKYGVACECRLETRLIGQWPETRERQFVVFQGSWPIAIDDEYLMSGIVIQAAPNDGAERG